MLGWELGNRPDLLLDSGDDEMDNEVGRVSHRDLGGVRSLVLPLEVKLKNESITFVVPSLRPSPAKTSRSRVGRKLTILKKAMTTKKSSGMIVKRMAKHVLVGINLLCLQDAEALESNGPNQSHRAIGKTFPLDLTILTKDWKSTWQTSCRESLKREQEVLNVAEETKTPGSVDENSRVV